jgi:alginate O-acetyltransferase complex protein AlgI
MVSGIPWMNFTSLIFLFYFLPLFLLIYNLVSREKRDFLVLLGSCAFLGWGSPQSLLLLSATATLDYVAGRFISTSPSQWQKRLWMGVGIVENIAVLFYFKYWDFFIHEFSQALLLIGLPPIATTTLLLPLGISFFTFHKISYLVDVYSKKVQPAARFVDFAVYVALFPKLLQGPIVPYHLFASRLSVHDHDLNDTFQGLFRFAVGLGKKVLIADVLGEAADHVFQLNFGSMTCGYAWLGILCYTFQIYFDFSGYTDMAIGIGRMLGFSIPENFNQPYLSRNFPEFWRRWHITLSAWFREYLYIPLGGNRGSTVRTYFNLWIVFLLSGLWHGSNWTFLVWGIYHGFFMVAERRWEISRKLGRSLSLPLTFVLLMIGWVFFRSQNLGAALHYLQKLFLLSPMDPAAPVALLPDIISNRGIFVLVLACFLSFVPQARVLALWETVSSMLGLKPLFRLQIAALSIVLILTLAAAINSHFRPFIYFRF